MRHSQTASMGLEQGEAAKRNYSHELIQGLDKKYQHDLIILDFSKAFDRVPHERLFKKLEHYSIMDNVHGYDHS